MAGALAHPALELGGIGRRAEDRPLSLGLSEHEGGFTSKAPDPV